MGSSACISALLHLDRTLQPGWQTRWRAVSWSQHSSPDLPCVHHSQRLSPHPPVSAMPSVSKSTGTVVWFLDRCVGGNCTCNSHHTFRHGQMNSLHAWAYFFLTIALWGQYCCHFYLLDEKHWDGLHFINGQNSYLSVRKARAFTHCWPVQMFLFPNHPILRAWQQCVMKPKTTERRDYS